MNPACRKQVQRTASKLKVTLGSLSVENKDGSGAQSLLTISFLPPFLMKLLAILVLLRSILFPMGLFTLPCVLVFKSYKLTFINYIEDVRNNEKNPQTSQPV